MPGELLLVNPRRKRRAGGRRKMSALQRKFFGGGRRKKRRTAPAVQVINRNPRKRRTTKRRRRQAVMTTRVRRNPRRSRRRMSTRYRRNPINFNMGSFINETLFPSAIGAGGALMVDMALGYATPYLPSFLTTGWGNVAARIAAAMGIGYLAQSVGGKRFGENVAAGGVIVTLYDVSKTMLQPYGLPGLSGYDLGYAAAAPQLGVYVDGDGTNYAQFGGSQVDAYNAYLQPAPAMVVTDTTNAPSDDSMMGAYV